MTDEYEHHLRHHATNSGYESATWVKFEARMAETLEELGRNTIDSSEYLSYLASFMLETLEIGRASCRERV